mgnify:CR=1 FL=1
MLNKWGELKIKQVYYARLLTFSYPACSIKYTINYTVIHMKGYASFAEFYPYYLQEHKNRTCRLMHFIGSTGVLLVLVFAIITQQWLSLLALPVIGYGFAWIGHFVFEKNRPATFKHPWYSLLGDWVMYKDIWTGKLSLFK